MASVSNSQPGDAKTFVEIFPPFLMAGIGMLFAGVLLDNVKDWDVFNQTPELFILVPALLGLKGNLEMTLASRLSTMANMGRLDGSGAAGTRGEVYRSNLALIQFQAVVVGTLAAVFAMAIAWLPTAHFDGRHALLLLVSGVATAATASFVLGLIMVLVVQVSAKYKVNPDNVATPIAASLGDLATLAILAQVSATLHTQPAVVSVGVLAVFYLAVCPVVLTAARQNPDTREVLDKGWTPILSAMMISSLGGKILEHALVRYPKIAAYQPLFNGAAGNLVAVHSSRLSTSLHLSKRRRSDSGNAQNDDERQTKRVGLILWSMVVPAHALFLAILGGRDPSPTSNDVLLFNVYYLLAALVQVRLLLVSAGRLVPWLWRRDIDPDMAAIPYLTALGDLLGGIFLFCTFYLHDQSASAFIHQL